MSQPTWTFWPNGPKSKHANASVSHVKQASYMWTWLFDEGTEGKKDVLLRINLDRDFPDNPWDSYDVPGHVAPMLKAWGREEACHLTVAEFIEDHWPECPAEFYQILRELAGCPAPLEFSL